MIEAIVIGMIIAKIKGYKLNLLFKDWAIYPVLGCTAVYVIFQSMIFLGNYSWVPYGNTLKFTFIAIFCVLILKYNIPKYSIMAVASIIVSTILNTIAMRFNGNKMPVFPTLSYLTGYIKPELFLRTSDGVHVLGNASVKLKFLTDVIDVGYCVMSIGDIFTRIFMGILIYSSIKYLNNKAVLEL